MSIHMTALGFSHNVHPFVWPRGSRTLQNTHEPQYTGGDFCQWESSQIEEVGYSERRAEFNGMVYI